jgi:hypothetical protein
MLYWTQAVVEDMKILNSFNLLKNVQLLQNIEAKHQSIQSATEKG